MSDPKLWSGKKILIYISRKKLKLDNYRIFSTEPKYERKLDNENPKAFEKIPGPKPIPGFGTLYKYLPLIGEYKFERLHHNGFRKFQQFGWTVREEIVPGVSIVWLFHPDDIRELFRVEGPTPSRRSHTALEKLRLDHPDQHQTGGLLPTNGSEWARIRAPLQRPMSAPKSVRRYLPETDSIAREFVERTARKYQNGKKENFLPELSRLFLELVGCVVFDTRLGSLKENLDSSSIPLKLIEASTTTNSCILPTDNGPRLWRWFPTPMYNKLRKSQEYMENIAQSFVHQKKLKLEENSLSPENSSLLESWLTSPELNTRDVVTMAVDMLMAGIDTTSYTVSFALYHLATNPDKQQHLYKESLELLPTDGSTISDDVLREATYLKATLKESFRLNPISVGIGRILPQDSVLGGYNIPKETVVVTQNQVSCRLEQFFPDPNRFMPERWIKSLSSGRTPHPFLVLPFGHGPRACIARRLAEQSAHVTLLRLVRRFEIGWNGGKLDCRSLLINQPDKPVYLSFKERGH